MTFPGLCGHSLTHISIVRTLCRINLMTTFDLNIEMNQREWSFLHQLIYTLFNQ